MTLRHCRLLTFCTGYNPFDASPAPSFAHFIMPIDRSKGKKKDKNTFSSLDDNDLPANERDRDDTSPPNDSNSPSDSEILRQIAESMRTFKLDFENYKNENDARSKHFEEKLNNITGTKDSTFPPNTNAGAQNGVPHNGSSSDSSSSPSQAPNVTPRDNDSSSSSQNQANNSTRQNSSSGTSSTASQGTNIGQNNFPSQHNNSFGSTNQASNGTSFTFAQPFGHSTAFNTAAPQQNPYAQNFSHPQNTPRTNSNTNSSTFTNPFSSVPQAPVPPIQRNFRPNNFNHPSGIVIFDRGTWANSTKHSTCADETFDTVHAWYDDIRGCMSAATGHKNVLPELEHLSATYDFSLAILPPTIQSNYNWAKEEFDSMSSALRVYFFRANTFSDKCRKILLQRKTHSSTMCGFTLLIKILGAIFPHMGSMPYNVNDKIAKLTLLSNETYDGLFERFLDIEKEVEMSLHKVSDTSVVEKYLDLLMTIPEVVPRLSAIFADFKSHMKRRGPNVSFRLTIEDIYDYLVCAGIVPTNQIQASFSGIPSGPQAYAADVFKRSLPQANAAVVSTDSSKFLPKNESRQTSKLVPRTNSCPVCYLRHDVNKCWVRGLKWMPLWLRRNVAKYNALHPNDEPDSTIINADPPLRKATVKSYNPTTKQAIFSFSDSDQAVDVANFEEFDTNFTDPDFATPTQATSNADSNTDPDLTIAHTSSPIIDPEKVNTLDDDAIEALLRDCGFHCGMADYTANPNGNPFSEHMLRDPFFQGYHCGMAFYNTIPTKIPFDEHMLSDISNPLEEYYFIGAPSTNNAICLLVQQAATLFSKDSGYIKVVWTHVDLGSNTHICNSADPIRDMQSANGGLGQVSGSKAPINGIGNWPVVLGQRLISLPETLVMPRNPTSTLGGFALKDKSGYSRVTHDINLFL